MATVFVRPGHLHTASRVLSATSETGLTVGPAVATSTNKGTLRPRTSGVPLLSTALTVRLIGGGNPDGYAAGGASGAWKNTTDGATLNRGYIDTPYLQRVEFPITTTALGPTSTPRELADGYLGIIAPTAAGTSSFYRISTAGAVTTVGGLAAVTALYRPDFVVLPSGRLIAYFRQLTTMLTYYSDDHGATWTALATIRNITPAAATWDVVNAEYSEDMIVVILSSSTGATEAAIYVSRDGGITLTKIGNTADMWLNARTCVAPSGQVIAASGPTSLDVRPITPGGMDGDAVDTGIDSYPAIVTRDDGTLWAFGFGSATALLFQASAAYSTDSGLTWTAASNLVLDCNDATPPTRGYLYVSAGTWRGAVVLFGITDSLTGTDGVAHMLTFGGWATITEGGTYESYTHTWVPTDTPDQFGWGTANVGAGATVTNAGAMVVTATGADNTYWSSPGGFWTTVAGDSRRTRARVKVVSGGSSTLNCAQLCLNMTDGANTQGLKLRFTSTSITATTASDPATAIGVETAIDSPLTITADTWYDLLIVMSHDSPAGGEGRAAVYYRKDTDAFGVWTEWFSDETLGEIAGVYDSVELGGRAGGATVWHWALVEAADDSGGLTSGFTNPDDLHGRELAADVDYWLFNGIHLGARNVGGIPGDTYTVGSTYHYPKEAVWQELRPSRQVRSSADGGAYEIIFDAGASDSFKGDTIAIFGTNYRAGKWQMNATNVWGAPSVNVTLDATVASVTIDAGNRGPGYVGATPAPGWRPGGFRSDGDAHRWFVQVGTDPVLVYEITDNDASRIYVEGVDFSAAAGTMKIFGDRHGGTFTFGHYRFARLVIDAQDTADGAYHVGTPICDQRWAPAQAYDHGFVDRVVPSVALFETQGGYRASSRIGPRRYTLGIQWPPIDNLTKVGFEATVRDFYNAIEGSHRPIVVWRNTSDLTTLGLYRVVGEYQSTNVWGELTNAVTRIDLLTLEEEW